MLAPTIFSSVPCPTPARNPDASPFIHTLDIVSIDSLNLSDLSVIVACSKVKIANNMTERSGQPDSAAQLQTAFSQFCSAIMILFSSLAQQQMAVMQSLDQLNPMVHLDRTLPFFETWFLLHLSHFRESWITVEASVLQCSLVSRHSKPFILW
ncbi:hypothetical protein ATANTOWER_021683 [Ataeniobius toweri]|uniref:Uncharacterized protein n=1 Tax=Ataeniobius toweri TaxID=208326 RepID=A0ABU7BJZ4_9TELE|nr:hypothetical protein [Ataeniobius toweri]